MSRWRRELPVLAGLGEEWRQALTGAGVPADSIGIEIEPAEEPARDALWNWWIYFSLGEVEVDAMVADGLDELVFEDESGRFEDEVTRAGVVAYLLKRVGLLPRRPRTPRLKPRRPGNRPRKP
ncbi:hypothetical protein [Amycolatopsis sp. CA-128772]|uniref:hypothetical protein n=1 Tax=Amycolatopsis sp. CA-128772 TaxID=2073159 RepID=UPI000CD2A02B|nr:hypothetical protein [Amycolatopsis sp. CA-128772]